MGYSNETPNYHLPQYLADDRPSYLGDWNEAMGVIDSGLQENKSDISDVDTKVVNLTTRVENTETDIDAVQGSVEAANNTANAANTKSDQIATDIASTNKILERKNLNLKNANIILIGDSYLRGVGATNGWGYYLKENINTTKVTEYGNSGAGFVAKGHTAPMNEMNFYDMVSYASTKTPLPDEVDYVIVGGGWNDSGSSLETVRNNVKTLSARVNNLFPNAEVVIVSLSNELTNLLAAHINVDISIVLGAHSAGASCPDHSWQWLKANKYVVSSDGIHPNDVGYQIIGTNIVAHLRGSNTGANTIMGDEFVVGETMTANTMRCIQLNGVVYLQGEFTSKNWSNSSTLGILPKNMRPARPWYVLAQFVGESYKQIVPVYIATNGKISPRTPITGAYPSLEATIYLPPISYPIGII